MNKDQAKGHMKDLAGKVREKLGSLTGNRKEQAKGLANQGEGKLQKGVGDLKNIANKDKER
ncbi:MAG: CsbD family protein [Betaproteobacteria bacterium]|nr:MAG: CsbD family protein [Betaproteobacteria bacterium]TMH42072.1 MAG: CsbD family protein [Betaproteobacteria bacterium]